MRAHGVNAADEAVELAGAQRGNSGGIALTRLEVFGGDTLVGKHFQFDNDVPAAGNQHQILGLTIDVAVFALKVKKADRNIQGFFQRWGKAVFVRLEILCGS